MELERTEELLAEDAPFWRLRQEVPRSRSAICRAVKWLRRPPVPEPNLPPLRLSLAERSPEAAQRFTLVGRRPTLGAVQTIGA